MDGGHYDNTELNDHQQHQYDDELYSAHISITLAYIMLIRHLGAAILVLAFGAETPRSQRMYTE